MNLTTKVNLPSPQFGFSHKDAVLLMGSCFSEEMGAKLEKLKFPTLVNPFGTLFHPKALETALLRIYTLQFYTEKEIFNYQDLYFSWDHSTRFSKPKLPDTLSLINKNLEKGHEHFQKSNIFIFTLGTAWVYELIKAGFQVSNCHKVPQSQFSKKLLSTAQVYRALKNITEICLDMNSAAKVIFTISPVRHFKDGAHDNQLSKASLFLGLEKVLEEYPSEAYYFPAYEIMMDELRDYRFYKPDMLHPNETAVNIIWDKFSNLFFSQETIKLNKNIEAINKSLAHRPQNPEALAHRKFLYDTLKKIEKIAPELPQGAFSKEISIIKEKIHHVN